MDSNALLLLSTGQQHAIKLKCCEHEPEAITLIRNGFWPSTPKQPQVAFDIQFMTLLQYVFLECRVSLKSIHQSLLWLSPPCSKVYVSTCLCYLFVCICSHQHQFCCHIKVKHYYLQGCVVARNKLV